MNHKHQNANVAIQLDVHRYQSKCTLEALNIRRGLYLDHFYLFIIYAFLSFD